MPAPAQSDPLATKPVEPAVVGNPDAFQLLFKAASNVEGWGRSTKALELPDGCLVQTSTVLRNPDGSYAVSDALCFIPNVRVDPDVNGGRKLVVAK